MCHLIEFSQMCFEAESVTCLVLWKGKEAWREGVDVQCHSLFGGWARCPRGVCLTPEPGFSCTAHPASRPSTGGVAFLPLKFPPVHSLGFYKRHQDRTQVARTQAHGTASPSGSTTVSACPAGARSLCLCSNSAPACLARCFFTLSELPSFKPQTHSCFPWPRQRCSSLI